MIIYISGKITNNGNAEQDFKKAEELLRTRYPDYEVINPFRTCATLPKTFSHSDYMSVCYSLLDRADAIYMIDGWRDSTGACIEYGYALAKDKIMLQPEIGVTECQK